MSDESALPIRLARAAAIVTLFGGLVFSTAGTVAGYGSTVYNATVVATAVFGYLFTRRWNALEVGDAV